MKIAIIHIVLFSSILICQAETHDGIKASNCTVNNIENELITSRTDSLLNDAYNKGIFSGLVVIYENGKEIYYKQSGYADWQTKIPIERNTLFNIGSLNKQFTEEIIHQLVKEKKLNYSDKLSNYLDLYPKETGNKITIQVLLDMKAGLGDYLRDPAFNKIRFNDFSMTDMLDIIKKEPLLFEPGTDAKYSNSGYLVLGAIIEKITGKSFEENLRNRIVNPLGLKNVYYSKEEKEKQSNRAFGNDIDFEGNKKGIDNIGNSTPAGGIYTNVNDLILFTELKRQSKLPSAKHYGNGMLAGGTPVWNSLICYNEQSGFSFVIMTNVGDIADELGPRINSILKNETVEPLKLPFIMNLHTILKEKGKEYIKLNAEKLAEEAGLPYDDRFLNYFGYQFMNGGNISEGIRLFEINVELFPTIANTHDSLAEAYLKNGDKTNALKYYKSEIQLDPGNARAKKAIEDLEGGK